MSKSIWHYHWLILCNKLLVILELLGLVWQYKAVILLLDNLRVGIMQIIDAGTLVMYNLWRYLQMMMLLLLNLLMLLLLLEELALHNRSIYCYHWVNLHVIHNLWLILYHHLLLHLVLLRLLKWCLISHLLMYVRWPWEYWVVHILIILLLLLLLLLLLHKRRLIWWGHIWNCKRSYPFSLFLRFHHLIFLRRHHIWVLIEELQRNLLVV